MKYEKGKRYLVRKPYRIDRSLIEVECLEVSPSGRVKLKFPGGVSWEEPDDYEIVEELP